MPLQKIDNLQNFWILVPRIHPNNGTRIKLITNKGFTCLVNSDKKILSSNDKVDLEAVNIDEPLISQYKALFSFLNFKYNNVPVDVVNDVIRKYGGLVGYVVAGNNN